MSRRRWPNLFLAGAAKAGTTSLHRYLDETPVISMSRPKETYFFSGTWDDVENDDRQMAQAEADYLDAFAQATDETYLGESTPGYLWHPKVPERIASRCEDPHIIISLRDPIERAHSDWAMARHRTGEDRSFLERVCYELDRDIEWGVVNPGRYATHVDRHIQQFGRGNVHPILFEDLKKNTLGVLEEIAEFLGLDPTVMEAVDYETVHNPYAEPKNAFAAWLRSDEKVRSLARLLLPERTRIWLGEHVLVDQPDKPPIEEEAIETLVDIYGPEIEELEEMLGTELDPLRRTWR